MTRIIIIISLVSILFSDNNEINKELIKNIPTIQKNQFNSNTNISNFNRAPLNPEYISFRNKQTLGRINNYTYDDFKLGYIPPPNKINFTSNDKLNRGSPVPETYDLRIENYLTPVRDQGQCGACWAFASYGSIESTWKKIGLGNFDLSENNENCGHGFEYGMCHGGNAHLASAYLARGDGPISESDDPYLGTAGIYHSGLTPLAYITDVRYLPTNDDVIKQAIYEHGALYTNLHVADSQSGETFDAYMDTTNSIYYYNGDQSQNHAVTLIGWDDTKVVNNAPGDGAWICKNSWGESWGENGFFYISYYDTKINEEVAYWPNRIDYTENIELHQYDKLGWTNQIGAGDSTAYALVKFSINDDQTLNRIGTWIVSSDAIIDITIYDNFDGQALSESDSLYGLNNQSCPLPGYYTFELETPPNLYSGESIYVKIKYTTPGYNHPIPLESAVEGYANPEIEQGIFWISQSGNSWLQLGNNITNWHDDPCIKLYGEVDTSVDCAGVPNGTATRDDCGVCTGGNTGNDANADKDCAGVCNGGHIEAGSTCSCDTGVDADCADVCGGSLVNDDCGVCDGDNSSCLDCAGVPNGDNVEDNCGTCDNDGTNDCADISLDCAGVPDGNNVEDNCGTCDSDPTNDCACTALGFDSGECVQDCAGTWGGTEVDDACDICGGDGPAEGFDCEGNTLSIYNDLVPEKYNINTIYPNPFNPSTNISFSIPEFGLTTITAYNIQGRKIETLINEVLPVGNYSIKWNASNYISGVYLIRMESGDFTQAQKVVLVK